jgi:plasmid stabilization system protein ParE
MSSYVVSPEADVDIFGIWWYSYMIVYRVKTRLEIVRVLHGRRNVRQILTP